MYDKNNVFAKIIRGEIPSKKLIETKHSLSFYDINPQAKIDILVIPKKEYKNILEFTAGATDAEKKDFWNLVTAITEHLKISDNFQLVANTGTIQLVPHFHIHILSDKK